LSSSPLHPEGESVVRRCWEKVTAALLIALQAIDAVVGAAGHSHEAACLTCAAPQATPHQHRGCSHHDHAKSETTAEGHRNSVPPQHDDDCTLCRHFSQPVAPLVVVVGIVGGERIEPLADLQPPRVDSSVVVLHSARGPPAASCA
jgi:hypothetical protein